MLGRNTTFQSQNRVLSPLLNRKVKASIFLTEFPANPTFGFTRKFLKTEPLPYTF